MPWPKYLEDEYQFGPVNPRAALVLVPAADRWLALCRYQVMLAFRSAIEGVSLIVGVFAEIANSMGMTQDAFALAFLEPPRRPRRSPLAEYRRRTRHRNRRLRRKRRR